MRVFIVDDSALMRSRIAEAALSVSGVLVSGSCSDVTDAYRRIRELKPDALIVDIQLRDGNGLDVVKQIKTERPEIKALVLSNSASSQYRRVALLAGADQFLDKSMEFNQLTTIFSAWLVHFQQLHRSSVHITA